MRRLRVLMSREEIVEERLPNSTVVVIDVFMATTTLLTILENGARVVFPVASLEEGEAMSRRLDASRLLKGGEQDALMIEGYDCGPFPEEYPPEMVSGKDVVYLTTNGTRAIGKAAPAKGLLIGSLRNAPAVARHLQETGPDSIYIICAGSGGPSPWRTSWASPPSSRTWTRAAGVKMTAPGWRWTLLIAAGKRRWRF